MINTNNASQKSKRKTDKEILQIKRLKTHDHHFGLTYRNEFFTLDWMKIINDLVTDFNKLTLIEKENNVKQTEPESIVKRRKQKSNIEQDDDVDILHCTLNDFQGDLDETYITSIDNKGLDNFTKTVSTIQHTNEFKAVNTISSIVSISDEVVDLTPPLNELAQQHINLQLPNTEKLRKGDQLMALTTSKIEAYAKKENSPDTIQIDSHKRSLTIKGQIQSPAKRCKLPEQDSNSQVQTSQKVRNKITTTQSTNLQQPNTTSNHTVLQKQLKKQALNTSWIRLKAAPKHESQYCLHQRYLHSNHDQSQSLKNSHNETIDSSTSRASIIKVFPNGDKIYKDGIITPFYHREPIWVKRRGEGHELRDAMSKLAKKHTPDVNKKKRDRTEEERAKQGRRRLANGLREWNLRPRTNKPFLDGRIQGTD